MRGRLQELTGMADPQLSAFAEFSLANMRESILHQSAEKLYQQRLHNLAAIELQSGYRRLVAVRAYKIALAQKRERLAKWRAILVFTSCCAPSCWSSSRTGCCAGAWLAAMLSL